jgi:ribosomal protein L14
VRGLILHSVAPVRFLDNTRVSLFINSVVLLKRRGLLKSKYIVGPLLRVIRRRQYAAIFETEL